MAAGRITRVEGVVLGDELGFTEGPAELPDGRVLFTSITGNIHSVQGAAVEQLVATGFGPTGLAVDEAGVVYVAGCSDLFGSPAELPAGVHRLKNDVIEPFLSEGLNAPNDICFGPDGRLYFTDPGDDPNALFERAIPGRVCAYEVPSGQLEVLDDSGFFPNGIAFDPSGTVLYVSESFSKRIVAYRLNGGRIAGKTVVAELEATPDGMALDAEGNIWQCVNPLDAIVVVDPHGTIVERFPTGVGSYPSNCCFAGPDRTSLFVTTPGNGAIAAFQPGVRGLPLYPFR